MRMLPYCLIALLLILFLSPTQAQEADSAAAHMVQPASYASGDSVIVQAGTIYKAGNIKRFFLGDHYRDIWLSQVKVPVINLDTKNGGLEILDQGGGMQTWSLKLKAGNGKLYSLRSIQKDPRPTVPRPVRSTWVADIVQDQISAAHPYGAFVLPALAGAAEIYHTNPQLYYLPDSPLLGEYRDKFGNMLMMLEEDADEDWSDKASFGYTENAVSTETVLEELRDENESYIDESFLLRARLFDMWIGDWDRHSGQWRWAELEDEDDRTFYRPIPEDRDNAFFRFDGFFPWWANRRWAMRKFQKFDDDIRDIAGLNYNARYFDRQFLTDLELEEWQQQAYMLSQNLTDDVIEEAFAHWPVDADTLAKEEIMAKLKARRGKLSYFARRYYKILAREVEVTGTNESEYFEVIRKEGGLTEVRVYDLNDGEKDELLYERHFIRQETKEIRLYGLGDGDYFHISGEADKGIKVRIIGGEGEDRIVDESRVIGPTTKTLVYDLPQTALEASAETRDKRTEDLSVNHYDPESFKYPLFAPQLRFGYNDDDGLFLGGGFLWQTHGFRKVPFAMEHRLILSKALASDAWNMDYNGTFTDAVAGADLLLRSWFWSPDFQSNFYGFGNGTTERFDNDYYNYRLNERYFSPALRLGDANQFATVGFFWAQYELQDGGDFLRNEAPALLASEQGLQEYIGFRAEAQIGKTDSDDYPERGVVWSSKLHLYEATHQANLSFTRFDTEIRGYASIDATYTTFATRLGLAYAGGDAPFFRAATLGDNQALGIGGNIRGLSRDRFSGRSAVFHNLDLRQKLFMAENYFLSLLGGMHLFVDHGRVWYPGDNDNTWHRSYGGGLWARLYFKWVFSATYARSTDGDSFNLRAGFLF